MIINRFFKVNSKEIVIFKVNFKLFDEKFWVFVTFYKNLYIRLWSRSRAKKTLAPAPARICCFTGSATLAGGEAGTAQKSTGFATLFKFSSTYTGTETYT
jgi:hypothetical protein